MKYNCIVLIGMAGAGKSTTGIRLAEVLGMSFIDLDVYIRAKERCSLQEIIDNRGEEILLKLEERYMYEIELDHRVVAPGGSIVYLPDLIAYLKKKAVLVYLDLDFAVLEKRILGGEKRGIVGLKKRTLRQIYDERKTLYSRYADFTVDTKGKTCEQVVAEISVWFKSL